MINNMDVKLIVEIIGLLAILCAAKGASIQNQEEELEVILEFLEFELEDICVQRSEAEWNFLNGTSPDLKKLLDAEMKTVEFYKKEIKDLQQYKTRVFNSQRLNRLMDIFFHMGAPLLDETEFLEYREYSTQLEEIKAKANCDCSSDCKCQKSRKEVEKELRVANKKEELQKLWTELFEDIEGRNKGLKYDFLQQLSILELEAENNADDDLAAYWLQQGDITWVNYETILKLWKDIIPLFTKIRNYLAVLIVQKHGKDVLIDPTLIPVHVLGSLHSENWIPAAEKLGAFQYSEAYQKLNSSLNHKSFEQIYKMADNFTSELNLGDLPPRFYYNSRFNVSSKNCNGKMMDYCKREHELRAIGCSDEDKTLTRFLEINEEVMKMKHLLLAGEEKEVENGYFFREGPRESVLYESVTSLSSLLAINPINLRKQNLLPNETLQNEEMLSLLMSALHVIPSLPYYLVSDLWRLNALKEIDNVERETTSEISFSSSSSASITDWSYDVEKRDISDDENEESEKNDEKEENEEAETDDDDLPGGENIDKKESKESGGTVPEVLASSTEADPSTTVKTEKTTQKIYDFSTLKSDWWALRAKYQGVGTPDGKLYADFLQDEKIIWNKPYISKFLGKILQFQLLERFKSGNYTANLAKLQSLLKKGKSKSWETLAEEIFNITEISTAPLLAYYKPLEEFLDIGGKFENKTPLIDPDSFKLFFKTSSLDSTPEKEKEGEAKAAEGSDAFLFILGCIAGIGVVLIIVTIARRKYRKKQRSRLKKRKAEELQLNL